MKVREVIKKLERAGWYLVRTKGSHRQFCHDDHEELVTVAGNLNADAASGTLHNIRKQSGVKI